MAPQVKPHRKIGFDEKTHKEGKMETNIAVFRGKEIRKMIHKNEWWFSIIPRCGWGFNREGETKKI